MRFSRGHTQLLLITSVLLAVSASSAKTSFRTIRTIPLSDKLIARDVRWAERSDVYVSTGRQGVIRIPTDSTAQATSVIPRGDRAGLAITGLVAVGKNHLFVASRMGAVGWSPLVGRKGAEGQKTLLTIMDIDARGDSAAILGADSGPLQGLARDGTIAWIGSLSKGLSDLRPVVKGRSSPGGKDMARCSILETGAIRFMQDGSLIVAPGAEPGIYRYSSSGKLMQTWDSGALGFVDDCSLDDEELHLLARDFGERIKWYSSKVILDEILPLADGPALVLRRVEKGMTKWDVVRLPYRGAKLERLTLPVTVPTSRGHVRGDVRGNEIVLLVFEDPLPGQKAVVPPTLLVLSLGGP